MRQRGWLLALVLLLAIARPAQAADLNATLAAYDTALGATSQAFTQPTLIQQVDESGEQVDFRWQQGQYREEYRWLGFTEVFAYDGQRHWYGSDINLPYALDGAAPASITVELCRSFAFLQPEWRAYLSPGTAGLLNPGLGSLPVPARGIGSALDHATPSPPTAPQSLPQVKGDLLLFDPPEMAEALLALDEGELHVYVGDRRLLRDSHVIVETHFAGSQQCTACQYAKQVITQTYDEGQLVHTQTSGVSAVIQVAAQPAVQFTVAGSPAVPSPALPHVPYSVDITLDDGAVIVPCTAPNGTKLKLSFDTGANIGLLRRAVVSGLGLTPTGTEQVSGHGGRANVGYVRAEGFRIGDAPIPAWPAAVLQEDAGLDRRLSLTGVDGLLGNFLLHSYVVQLDYPQHKLRLWPRAQFDPAQLTGAFAAPLHRERLPWTDVVVDGKIKGGAYFNTGGRYPFALAYWACDDAGVTYPVESMGRGVSVGGSAMFGMVRPGEVQLVGLGGHLDLKSPLTMLEMLGPGEPKARYKIGSFGSGFLSDYAVTFDLEHERIYLAR